MARLQLMFKERRLTERRKLTGLMPGRLKIEATGRELNCKPVDVSKQGVGILVAEQLEPGITILLSMHDETIPLQIAWGQKDFGKQDLFRYGLVTVDPDDNLELIFLRTGCLK